MQIVNPKHLKEITIPRQPEQSNNNDKYLEWLDRWANRIANTAFILLEFFIGIFIYLVLLISIWKMFLINDAEYITKAKRLIEFINTNWIGFLFLPPLIFFRLIILKITNLKDAKGVVFGEGATLYRTGDYNGQENNQR